MTTPLLTLLYDGNCPVCVSEMTRLAQRDVARQLDFINIAVPGFDATHYGTTMAALNAELHAVTPEGKLLIGIDCMIPLYQAVGLGWRVWPMTLRVTQPFWRMAYRWFARNRYTISRLFGARCPDGVCDIRRV